MSSVLLIDADGELWYTRQEELGVECISMPYTYNDNEYYYDLGKNTDLKKFYQAIRDGAIPKTMALNPQEYYEIIEKHYAAGNDVLYVSFSHAMSGTFNHLNTALNMLAEKYPDRKTTVFNTNSISLGAGLQMEYAAELKNKGASDEEILAFLKEFTNRSAVYFVVDDLMHLKRGGRLSGFAAFAGTLLSLKPILTIDAEGKLGVLEKVAGKKKAIRNIADKVNKTLTGLEYRVYVLDADCPADGDMLADLIKQAHPDANIIRQTVGPVIGAHCGPGTVGAIFIADQRPIPLKAD
ncbi:MAG: DegV family protein [Clostridia bacterium]|nr:DegV family protein [Clostridia bacterium]MBQ8772092.1 DegV family protein [Clostridia bacterium]